MTIQELINGLKAYDEELKTQEEETLGTATFHAERAACNRLIGSMTAFEKLGKVLGS